MVAKRAQECHKARGPKQGTQGDSTLSNGGLTDGHRQGVELCSDLAALGGQREGGTNKLTRPVGLGLFISIYNGQGKSTPNFLGGRAEPIQDHPGLLD